jgi:hypothetical protein
MHIDLIKRDIIDITIHFQHERGGEYPHDISSKFQLAKPHMVIEKPIENIFDIDKRQGY